MVEDVRILGLREIVEIDSSVGELAYVPQGWMHYQKNEATDKRAI